MIRIFLAAALVSLLGPIAAGAARLAATVRCVAVTATTPAAVVVPVKAFDQAKVRLAGALSPPERADLARHMAEIVLLAAHPLPVLVVCDDEAVRAWAERSGAQVVWCPGRGLNGAVSDGVTALRARGVRRVIVGTGNAGIGQLAYYQKAGFRLERIERDPGRELEEARELFPDTVVPRDFDTVEIPFAERGAPALVRAGARARKLR